MDSVSPLCLLSRGRDNYGRLCRLLVGVGNFVLTDLFDRMCPPVKLNTILNDAPSCNKLQILRIKGVLSMSQWQKLYPAVKSSVNSKDFSPSLQLLLLSSFFGLKLPASGQDNFLPGTDTSPEAGIAYIKVLGDKVYCHSNSGSVDDITFNSYWEEIKCVFLRFGRASYEDDINALKFEKMDDEDAVYHGECLREWKVQMEGSTDISEQNSGREENGSAGNSMVSPPKLTVTIPMISELPETSLLLNNAELPVDILLFTVENVEFASCFAYLEEPMKYYHIDTGYVYIGCTTYNKEHSLKIALMKCSKGSVVPGGSLSASQIAISLLKPKALFSVGACSGVDKTKVKRGDVIVSSKLITVTHKVPPSRNICNLIRNIADGWKAPVEKEDGINPVVHCGALLSISEENKDIIDQNREAIAVETEGAGFFTAANDLKMEWLIVKGIKDFVNDSQSCNEKCKEFASVMAASVVFNLLRDPVIFKYWPHFSAGF